MKDGVGVSKSHTSENNGKFLALHQNILTIVFTMAEAAVNLSHSTGGLPSGGIEVSMSLLEAQPTFSEEGQPLYTKSMGDCICIATFDHEKLNKKRTLTHLWGGAAAPSFYETLAADISPRTTVIVACGSIGRRDYFETVTVPNVREMLESHMAKLGKATNNLQWLSLWTENEAASGLIPGSFVIQVNGEYGRIKA